jgi:hypothetical protein
MTRLKRSTIRHIEAELQNYPRTLEYMEQLRRDVIFAGTSRSFVSLGRAAPTTSTVERLATRLADSLLLREMERVTTAIRTAYARTKEEARREGDKAAGGGEPRTTCPQCRPTRWTGRRRSDTSARLSVSWTSRTH